MVTLAGIAAVVALLWTAATRVVAIAGEVTVCVSLVLRLQLLLFLLCAVLWETEPTAGVRIIVLPVQGLAGTGTSVRGGNHRGRFTTIANRAVPAHGVAAALQRLCLCGGQRKTGLLCLECKEDSLRGLPLFTGLGW